MTAQTQTLIAASLLAGLASACTTAPETAEAPIATNSEPLDLTPEEAANIPPSPSVKPDLPQPAPATEALAGDASVFPKSLSLCPRMTISNAPKTNSNQVIRDYQQTVTINGIELAVAPVEAGCFSSGFGPRDGRRHKGIDLHNATAVDVYAAADGLVREKVYRDDYGNMLVIEHGDGVFARYAHLESFAAGVAIGDTVARGQTIGVMGNTASYRIARHLHYEVLTGTYGTLTASFGLTPVDIFAYLSGN